MDRMALTTTMHGPKKHLGNRQRIAHATAPPIRRTPGPNPDATVVERYLRGTEEDVTRRIVGDDGATASPSLEHLKPTRANSPPHPAGKVRYMLNTDTTLLSSLLPTSPTKLKVEFPEDEIRVKAYEGVGKGRLKLV